MQTEASGNQEAGPGDESGAILADGIPGAQQGKAVVESPKVSVPWWAPNGTILSCWPAIKMRFNLSSYYDDNIFIQHDNKTPDFVNVIGLGMRTGWGKVENPLSLIREQRGVPLLYEDPNDPVGNFLLADYTGSAVLYANTSGQDAFDQDALVRAGWTGPKLALAFAGRFQALSASDIDVGTLTRQRIYSSSIGAKYALSGKTSVESTGAVFGTDYQGFNSTTDWLQEDWVNYQITSKINVGPGAGVGLTEIENSPSQTFERIQCRATYQITKKFSFSGKAGVEFRQLGGGLSSRQDPICSLGATYTPFDGTTIMVDAYRSMGISAVNGSENFVQTGADLTVQQRLIQKLHLSISGGYENLHYLQTANGTRDDNYLYSKIGIAFDLTKWCDALVFYNCQKDQSTQVANTFLENRVGLGLNCAF